MEMYMGKRYASQRQRQRLYILQGGLCRICGIELLDHFPVDHIMPFSKGGKTTLPNLQALCEGCHVEKNGIDGSQTINKTGAISTENPFWGLSALADRGKKG
mgnify:CR=1 FL=1